LAGIAYEILEYQRDPDSHHDFGREAAAALNLPDAQVFKTLMVRTDASELIVAVIPVTCKLSMKLTAAAIGAKKVAMCDPAEAERSSGYVVGGISPIGQRKTLRTVIDESAQLFETVYVSGGKRGMDIGMAPSDLRAATRAAVASVTAER
jgi:Cys-tRNA(Pro)/Cys-tRNA(Cys) deacylase